MALYATLVYGTALYRQIVTICPKYYYALGAYNRQYNTIVLQMTPTRIFSFAKNDRIRFLLKMIPAFFKKRSILASSTTVVFWYSSI